MTATQVRSRWQSSSRRHPCPVCGRSKDGKCRRTADTIHCWHGSSHHPPAGLRRGDVLRFDGGEWAVVNLAGGFGNNSLVLCPHQPGRRSGRRRLHTAPPQPTPPAEPFWSQEPDDYRPTHWIIAALYQRHCLAMGWEVVL